MEKSGQALALLQEAFQNKLMACLPETPSHPLTSHYYPYMIKLKNTPVVYGLMGISCIFILHLMSESIQGKNLHLSISSDLGHI